MVSLITRNNFFEMSVIRSSSPPYFLGFFKISHHQMSYTCRTFGPRCQSNSQKTTIETRLLQS